MNREIVHSVKERRRKKEGRCTTDNLVNLTSLIKKQFSWGRKVPWPHFFMLKRFTTVFGMPDWCDVPIY